MDKLGPSFSASPEFMAEYKNELKEANRDKWINAFAQGIGGALQAQTPYAGQAIGTGLLAGAAGFQQGSKEEADLRKQMMALRLASEKEGHADRRSAVSSVYKTQADTAKLHAQQALKEWEKRGDWANREKVAAMITGGKAAGLDVDPNEMLKGITDLYGKLQSNQRNKLDATLVGLDDFALWQRAIQMYSSALSAAPERLQSVNRKTRENAGLLGTLNASGLFN